MSELFAKELAGMTLIGAYSKTYPYKHGNCFSVYATDDKEYKIVNFVAENFQALWKFECTKPIRIKTISERHAVINDERIPHNWYPDRFCTICCPHDLLPTPQKLTHEREERCGMRKQITKSAYQIDFRLLPQWESKKVD